jgi:16S rRNA (adenine1518-N6/adenine1519-N6)-dimethyltransferase
VLTRYLAERVAHVHAVELDRSLEPQLSDIPNTTLHWLDALKLDPAVLDPAPTRLVSNLPYNIATPIVVESLDRFPSLESWCVMVQREVADRFFAAPGTKAYGAVSVLVQLVTARTGFHAVSREVFRPRPNVDSALVAFKRVAPSIPPGVKRIVEGSFAHRRKTLANSLALTGIVAREQAAAALGTIGRDANVRAEALSPAEFVSLATALQ